MSETDHDILSKARSGDPDAFMQLVTVYEKKVYSIALGIMKDASDASDMTQEAFIKAFRSIKNFRMDCSFGTWIYRITVNVCMDELRKRKHVQSVESLLDSGIEIVDGQDSYEKSDLSRIIKDALMCLPEVYRIPIILVDIRGLSYSEAAEVLSLPEGTVKSRLHRARAIIRKALEDAGLP
ncbi:MAG TPA: sigma-70 family RNA polymerase sigma factor [Clostridia bacterium]|nr:sigma-70 family RNA polymerase sigma factor [Clostridia bacterium]